MLCYDAVAAAPVVAIVCDDGSTRHDTTHGASTSSRLSVLALLQRRLEKQCSLMRSSEPFKAANRCRQVGASASHPNRMTLAAASGAS